MDRSTTLLLLALLIGAFGLYTGLSGIALLLGGGTPLLMLSFLAQGVLALAAAYGIARAQSWAPSALRLLAAVVAATALIEAFVLGILPWLSALFIAVIALVLALAIGGVVRGGRQG